MGLEHASPAAEPVGQAHAPPVTAALPLNGKTVLVTGASRGIGAAIARRCAAAGGRMALVARTAERHPHLEGSLRTACDAIRADGNAAHAFVADLSDAAGRERLIDEVVSALGPIHVLVNNAAANFFMPFEQISAKRFAVVMEVNCRAPFDLAQRVAPGMREAGSGWIVNVSSATARMPGLPFDDFDRRGHPVLYGMSKAALDRLSTGLAAELYDDGIAVNSLSPVAAVATPGVIALGQLPARDMLEGEERMAEAALALATCEPKTMTGRIAFSGPLLDELGRPTMTLDGRAEYDGRIRGIDA